MAESRDYEQWDLTKQLMNLIASRDNQRIRHLFLSVGGFFAHNRRSLLHCAILAESDDEILEMLLTGEAEVFLNESLHVAVEFSRNDRIIDLLLRRGADPTVRDHRGRTAHFIAVVENQFENSLKIFRRLRGRQLTRADERLYFRYYRLCLGDQKYLRSLDDVDFLRFPGIESPLYHAVVRKDRTMVEKLLKKGADPCPMKNLKRCSAFHRAIALRSMDTVRIFLRYGADARSLDENGNTTLIVACTSSGQEMFKVFSDCGIDPNLTNFKKETPLHLACRCSCVGTVEALLDLGAKMNVRDRLGNTPLYYCMSRGFRKDAIRSAQLLLSRGADANIKNLEGRTSVDEADVCEVLILLLKLGGTMNLGNFQCNCFINERFDPERDLCPVIRHLAKLRLLGYETEFVVEPREAMDNYENIVGGLAPRWMQELEMMKEVEIARYPKKLSLYDLIFINKREFEKYMKNDNLRRTVEDCGGDFENFFPHYGFLLNRHYREASRRRDKVEEAKILLDKTLGMAIPHTCNRKIFNFLSDDDLGTLVVDRKSTKNTGTKYYCILQ